MKNSTPFDILLLIIITILAVICIIFLPLSKYQFNIVSYLLLAVFLSGYSIIGVFFPRKGRIGSYRIILSIVISLIITFIFIILNKYNLIDLTTVYTFVIIGIFTLMMFFIGLYRLQKNYDNLNKKNESTENKSKSLSLSDNINGELTLQEQNNDKNGTETVKQDNIKHKNSGHSIKDIIFVLILTLASLFILLIPSSKYLNNSNLYVLKPMFSYLLIFILSGYAFWAALVPKKALIKINRLILVLLFGIALFGVSIFTLKFNLFTGPSVIYALILSIFIFIMCLIAVIRRKKTSKKPDLKEKYIDSTKPAFNSEELNNTAIEKPIKDTLPELMINKEEQSYKKLTLGKKYLDTILVFIFTLICLIVILTPNLNGSILKTVLIIPLILFLPGYSLIAAIYRKDNDLDAFERLALSFGFPLIGIAITIVLNTIIPVKINLTMILGLLAIFTLSMTIIAVIRRSKVPEEEKFHLFSRNKISIEDIQASDNKKTNEIDLVSVKETTNKNMAATGDESKLSTPFFVSKDLLLIFLTTIAAIFFIITPKFNDSFLRILLSLFLILFLSGYSLIAALFPKKDDLDGIERIALSFGLSIAVTALIGLVLNYTPWGIRLTPILISLSAFTIIMLLIAFLRKRKVSEDKKFFVDFGGFFTSIKDHFSGESKTSKILSIILILTIILAISTTVYIIVKPKQGETFTEFYILGQGGKASNYPTNLTVGQNASVIIGIVNHEYKTVNYELVVSSNGTVMSDQNITLTNGNQTQIPYSFTANSAGEKELQFLLYKLPDKTNLYRSLHLFVNIT